jgi:hypothetical protein
MKKLLLLSIILAAFQVDGQTTGSIISTVNSSRGFYKAPTISINNNEKITVVGDSLTAIKDLLKLCEKLSKESGDNKLDFFKAVDFINDIPVYFTKNEKYKAYIEATKRQGFKSYKRK